MPHAPRRARLSCEPLDDRVTPVVLPDGFTESLVAGGLSSPTALAVAPDGRVFVTEQTGRIRVVEDGELLPEPFAALTVDSQAERGLLGITFDPDFAANQFVYVYYTVPGNGPGAPFNRLSRLVADGNTAAAGGEQVLVDFEPRWAGHHNGGAIRFGPDGKLYVAVGDGFDPTNAQSLDNRMGKILRYNPDGTIPDDNPTTFPGIPGTPVGDNRAIWAVGLRNPYTFDFDPATGRMLINDVGQDLWEEVNEGGPGRNFGWPQTEGDFDPAEFPAFTRPVLAYAHGFGPGEGYSVVGGTFYSPPQQSFPADYSGGYFYGDFLTNWIWWLDPDTGTATEFATQLTGAGLIGLAVTEGGDLLYLARGHYMYPSGTNAGLGGLYAVRAATAPAISTPPADVRVLVGEAATFFAEASGTGDLAYQWQRDGRDIPGATGQTYTLPRTTLADSGAAFRVVVTNEFGEVTSAAATLTVSTNLPPTAFIEDPEQPMVRGGEVVVFSGTAIDPEDGPLPASAFTWRVDYITGDAPPRPLVPPTTGSRGGSFTVPTNSPYTRPDVLFRVVLTVTDSEGNTVTVTRDLRPVTAEVTLRTTVGGVPLALDGQPVGDPHTFVAVAGFERRFTAPQAVTVAGRQYTFAGWSDGVRPSIRTVSMPEVATTYTAVYETEPEPEVANPAAGLLVGSGPDVRLIDAVTGATLGTFAVGDSLGTGAARVAAGDMTGDGVADVIVAAGPGGPPVVLVYDGVTRALVGTFDVFEPGFRGGLFVAAADFDRDGRADLVVSADEGGGPRVRVLSGRTGAVLADFFGIDDPNFRGGARVAVGDVNRDGVPDLVVAAGFGGGPRVAVYDGLSVSTRLRTPARLVSDFFVFEGSVRNGAFVSAGDVDGDGFADLAFGGGPDGGPRVRLVSGRVLLAAPSPSLDSGFAGLQLANFYAGDEALRGGVRLAIRDTDGDGRPELVAASGTDEADRVRVYRAATLLSGPQPKPNSEYDPFEGTGLADGVFVG